MRVSVLLADLLERFLMLRAGDDRQVGRVDCPHGAKLRELNRPAAVLVPVTMSVPDGERGQRALARPPPHTLNRTRLRLKYVRN